MVDNKTCEFLAFARRFPGVRISQPINMGRGTIYSLLYKRTMIQLLFKTSRISVRVYDRNRCVWTALTGSYNSPANSRMSCHDLSLTTMVHFRVLKTKRVRHLAAFDPSDLPKVEAFFVAVLSVVHDWL